MPWSAELLDAFAPSVEANPWGWGTAREVLDGSLAWEVTDGRQCFLIAARPVVREHGTRLDITGLVSLGERIRGASIDDATLQIAAGLKARALAMATLRPHVAATAARIGWTQAGVLMTKKLDLQ